MNRIKFYSLFMISNNKLIGIILSIFILACISFSVHAQEELKELLAGKSTLSEIMPVVDQYYKNHPEEGGEEFESEYLEWKRWEWYMSGRLGHGGEFVNISELLMKGLKEKNEMEVSHDRNINSGWTFMGPSSSPLQNNSALNNEVGRV